MSGFGGGCWRRVCVGNIVAPLLHMLAPTSTLVTLTMVENVKPLLVFAVLLCLFLPPCRDSFFTRAEFSQLLFAACTPWKPGGFVGWLFCPFDSDIRHLFPILRLGLTVSLGGFHQQNYACQLAAHEPVS